MIGCQYLIILCVPLIVLNVVSYDLTCPENLHRTYRMQSLCNTTLLTSYSCLLDRHSNKFNESCEEEPNFVRPGQRYVINGFRTNTDCSKSTYQPFKFWSQKYSKCIYIKSSCNGIGQLLYESNSAIEDNKCGCDHKNGYAFLVKPNNTCYCVPIEQDCTCFQKECPPYTSLSPDNRCISNVSSSKMSLCQKKIHPRNMDNTDIIYKMSSDIRGGKQMHRRRNYVVMIIVFAAIFLMCLAGCLIEHFQEIEKLFKRSKKEASTVTLSKFQIDADKFTMVHSTSSITISLDQSKLNNFNQYQHTQAHYEIKYRQQGQVLFTSVRVSNGVSELKLKELKSNTWHDINTYICGLDGHNHPLSKTTFKTLKHCAYFLMDRYCFKDSSEELKLYQMKPENDSIHMNENISFGNASQVRYYDMIEKYQCGINTSEEKTLLLLGKTGTGKSTLINALMNYAAGVSYNDDHRFVLVNHTAEEEANTNEEHESQTSSVTVYRLPKIQGSRVRFKLNIIDTPGFNDTRQDFDSSITTQIKEVLEGEIHHLDAILIVVSYTTTSLDDVQRHIFTKIVNMFGKDITQNVFVAITHFEGYSTKNIRQVLTKADVPCTSIFKFNNSNVLSKRKESNQSKEEEIWSNRSDNFDDLFEELNTTPNTEVQLSVEVMRIRINIDNHLSLFKEHLNELARAIANYKASGYKKVLKKIEEEGPENKRLSRYYDKVPTIIRPKYFFKSTNCKKCESTCRQGSLFSGSKVISSGKCNVCHCGESSHQREHSTYEIKYEKQLVCGKDAVDNRQIRVNEMLSLKCTLFAISNLITELNQKALAKNSVDLSGIVQGYIINEESKRRDGFETKVQILQKILDNLETHDSIQELTIEL